MRYRFACVLIGLLVLGASTAGAWTVKMHIWTAEFALNDARDGKIDLAFRVGGKIVTRSIALHPDVRDALRQYPNYYRAGVGGPDGYPDTASGQVFTHSNLGEKKVADTTPHERRSAKNWRSIDTAMYLFRRAWALRNRTERLKALAFVYGFITHYAGDGWGHHYVNSYAGGAWNYEDGLKEEVRHLVIESFIAKHLPRPGPYTNLGIPTEFVVANLIYDPVIRQCMPKAKHLHEMVKWERTCKSKAEHHDKKYRSKSKVDPRRAYHKWLRNYFRKRLERTRRAIRDWVQTTWTNNLVHLQTADIRKIKEEVSTWWDRNRHAFYPNLIPKWLRTLFKPLLALIRGIGKLIEKAIWKILERPLKPFLDAFEQIKKKGYKYVFDNVLYKDNGRTRREIMKDMGISRMEQPIALERFHPGYNTAVLSKLILLDAKGLDELRRIANQLNVSGPQVAKDGNWITTTGWFRSHDNVMWECVASLDQSNQLWQAPKCRLFNSTAAVKRLAETLFLPLREKGGVGRDVTIPTGTGGSTGPATSSPPSGRTPAGSFGITPSRITLRSRTRGRLVRFWVGRKTTARVSVGAAPRGVRARVHRYRKSATSRVVVRGRANERMFADMERSGFSLSPGGSVDVRISATRLAHRGLHRLAVTFKGTTSKKVRFPPVPTGVPFTKKMTLRITVR